MTESCAAASALRASEWRQRRRRTNKMKHWETWADAGAYVGMRQPDMASAVRRPATRGATWPSSSKTGRCTVDSIQWNRWSLTAILDSVISPNLLLNSKYSLHESCSLYSHLKLLLKDQGLILNRYRVKSHQSWVHETETQFSHLESNPNSDLWDLFEHVVHIFMTWPLNKICSI